jgi:hypothetical protein
VTVVLLVISGLLVGAKIGISCYGAVTPPSDARVPLHYGFGSYNNVASKTVGLIMWPVGGAVIFGLLTAVSVHLIKPNHPGSGAAPLIIMPVVLAIAAFSQWGAISLARNNAASPQD